VTSILLVDHEDSFVHTLANYFRQTGAKVTTVRRRWPDEVFDRVSPDLVVLSPGRAARRTSIAPRRSRSSAPASCRSSASASACRR
jgi:anthranilate/para-aminobenzoate synthase component II